MLTCTALFSDTLEWQELDMKEEHMVLPLKCSPESLFRNGNPPSGSHFSATRVAALIFCKLQFSTRRALPVFMLGNWPRCLSQSSAPPQRDQDLAVNETGPKGGRFQISTRESTRPCWQIRLYLAREAVPGGISLVRKEMPRTSLRCEPWEKTVHICFGNGLPNGSLLQTAICAVCSVGSLQSTDYPRHVATPG